MSVEVITTISPTTDEPILTRNGISAEELELLPETATRAFESWRKTTLQHRQDIVKKALKILDERQDELANELTVQMGRPIAYTAKEVTTAIKRAEYLLKISEDVLQDTPGEAEKGFKRFIRKVPVGPVLTIFAWNVSAAADTDEPSWRVRANKAPPVPLPDPRQRPDTGTPMRQLSHPQALPPDSYRC